MALNSVDRIGQRHVAMEDRVDGDGCNARVVFADNRPVRHGPGQDTRVQFPITLDRRDCGQPRNRAHSRGIDAALSQGGKVRVLAQVTQKLESGIGKSFPLLFSDGPGKLQYDVAFSRYSGKPIHGRLNLLRRFRLQVDRSGAKPNLPDRGGCNANQRSQHNQPRPVVPEPLRNIQTSFATSSQAAICAVEAVDECVGKVVGAALARGGGLLVTADHGNCEQMIDPVTGGPHTAHTSYDVPLIVVDERDRGRRLRAGGRLADLAPTALDMLGLLKPGAMTGTSLIQQPRILGAVLTTKTPPAS